MIDPPPDGQTDVFQTHQHPKKWKIKFI